MLKESMTIRENADVKIVDVNEDLGNYVAANLRQTLEALEQQSTLKIVMNLSQVKHISSTAIGALVGVAMGLRRKGGDLKVYGLRENLTRTFDLVGASGIVEICASESSAAAAFQVRTYLSVLTPPKVYTMSLNKDC